MLRVAAAQTAPAFLDRVRTTERILSWMERAAQRDVQLLAFGETFLPGYPMWLSHTGGARFEDPEQKRAYAAYLEASVSVDGPEIEEIAARAAELGLFVVLGIAERCRGSIYCTALPIHPSRGVLTGHRKLVPTHEERLAWAAGDGHGLRAHDLEGVKVTVLNCWENWMPQARHAMYAAGSELHVAIWPGNPENTQDITRFIAREGRTFVLSAASLLRRSDIPSTFPLHGALPEQEWFFRGGSAIAGPDGAWLVEPVVEQEELVVADLDMAAVREERQNFDPVGHYSRPDVFDVTIDRRRRASAKFRDEA